MPEYREPITLVIVDDMHLLYRGLSLNSLTLPLTRIF